MIRGIQYHAQGAAHFTEALASAASSLRHNNVPHVVFTDCEPPHGSDGVQFVSHERRSNPYADRIEAMGRTPFEQTIHLDTDTYVAGDITGLFDVLARFDIAAANAPGYLGHDDPEVPPAFYEFNAGVIAYRTSPEVLRLLADWRSTYLAWLEYPPFEHAAAAPWHEQPALRHCIWKSGLSVYAIGPEYNYRTVHPGRLVGKAKVIYGQHADYPALVARLNEGAPAPRCFPRLTEH